MGVFLKRNYLIILIFLLALGIRILGVYPGYSDNYPDESLGYGTAIHMYYNNLVPNSFDYGSARPFFLLLFFKFLILPFVYFNILLTKPAIFFDLISQGGYSLPQYQDILFGQRMINAMYWARYIGVLLGAFSVIFLFLCAKKLFNQKVALFTSIFLAVNYRHVLSSVMGVPDIFNSFFFILSFYFSINLLIKNDRKNYLLAAIAAGIAFSIKYQFFPLLPLILAHLIWAIKNRSFLYLFNRNIIYSGIAFLITFLLLNPFLFFNLSQFLKESSRNYLRYQMGVTYLRSYPYFYLYHWGIGELVSIAILLGTTLMFLLKRLRFIFIFSLVFPFFFFMTYYSNGGVYTRNFSAIIPFLFIYAGFFFYFIYSRLKSFFLKSFLILLFIIINALPLYNSFLLSYNYSRQWNSDNLMAWLGRNLPANSSLRNYNLNLSWKNRDEFASILTQKNIKQSSWNYLMGPNSLAEFQEEGTDFAILNDVPLQSMTYWWRGWKADKLFKYSGVPIDYISNGFYGLSVSELMNYTVTEIYKPWQAADANSYLVFKIPEKTKDIGQEKISFSFDNQKEMWDVRGSFGLTPAKFGYSSLEGRTRKGALVAYGGGEGDTSRLSSQAIPVMGGKTYTVSGWIKNSPKGNSPERDGFLRIDFYANSDKLDMLGIKVAISPRVLLSDEWIKEDVVMRAPKEARFMTISLQRQSGLMNFITYLDDVAVFESSEIAGEKYKELPYIDSTIPLEDLYHNTFL